MYFLLSFSAGIFGVAGRGFCVLLLTHLELPCCDFPTRTKSSRIRTKKQSMSEAGRLIRVRDTRRSEFEIPEYFDDCGLLCMRD